eukprot:jgi/Psemu1/4393/gm1.4393_g
MVPACPQERGGNVGNGRRRSNKTLVTAIGAGDCDCGKSIDGSAGKRALGVEGR